MMEELIFAILRFKNMMLKRERMFLGRLLGLKKMIENTTNMEQKLLV